MKVENRIAFPLTVIETTYGRTYKFMIFSRKSLSDALKKRFRFAIKDNL